MTAARDADPDPQLPRPLTARSTVLSLLLGAHPAELPGRDIIDTVERFGISEGTARVALSRMVASGDLVKADGAYHLGERLLGRQARQDEAIHPSTREWSGTWEMAVITVVGREPADRAELRANLAALRLAELREGIWMRPANLRRPWPGELDRVLRRFTGHPDEEPEQLAGLLWDLESWAATAVALLGHLGNRDDPGLRFTAAAASVRHLLDDPLLPPDLLPADWPGATLREVYIAYQAETTPHRAARPI